MLTASTLLRTARGLGRYAARKGIPLGTAYLADCRAYGIQGTFGEYAEAYEDERVEVRA